MPYPNLANKHEYASVTGPGDFLDAARAVGWDPGPIPHGVVFTYSPVITRHLEERRNRFVESPALAPSNARYFETGEPGARIGISCLVSGAPAMATQLQNLIHLGVKRFITIGTAGSLSERLQPGHTVVLTSALRDDGVSHHFLAPDRYAYPTQKLTARLQAALADRSVTAVEGKTWTIAVPFRMTALEIDEYASEGVMTVEMEAAALFAIARVGGVECAGAVVVGDITTSAGRVREDWAATRAPLLSLLGAAVAAVESIVKRLRCADLAAPRPRRHVPLRPARRGAAARGGEGRRRDRSRHGRPA